VALPAELASITGIIGVDATNESEYQAAVAVETGLSNLPSLAQVQAIVDAVNASEDALAAVLEDSSSVGGSNNSDGAPVTVAELASITGIVGVDTNNEAEYQTASDS